MKVLITGGCGFLGSTLALYLRERGHGVVAMDNLVRRGSESNIERLQKHDVAFVHGDVRCVEDFAGLPPGIDLICDASAQPSVVSGYTNPMFDLTNNTLGVFHVLEFARERRCPLIFCSTNRIYSADRINALPRREGVTRLEWDAAAWKDLAVESRPPGFDPRHGVSEEFSLDGAGRSIYGVSKLMADVVCQEYADAFDIPIIINRLGVISGAGQFGKIDQGWVVWWAVACWFGLPLKYIGWGGKQVRDILFVEDVCRLVDLEISQLGRLRSGVFNAGGGAGNSLSLLEATQFLENKLGRSMSITHEQKARKADTVIYITDNRKVERELGWKPQVSISQGLDSIVNWIRKNEAELSARYRPAG
ncbi:MAG TPA: NAD-dependent epimerase/dehydratase family protein [Candidatus Acidoferrales bacterium]|nr:NAD-dependent epimerase/dehydratase family protein [Candidatus Acidoferrales bacterium]